MSVTIIADSMTPLERLTAFIEGKPYDRIPINPSMGDHACIVAGSKVSECNLSAKKMAEAQIAAYREYGHDFVGTAPGQVAIPEAVGSIIGFPDYSTAYVKEPVVKEISDLERLEIPNPHRDGRLPIFLEANNIILDEIGKEVPVGTIISGPLTTASSLRGTEKLMRDIYNNPEFVHKLLEFSLNSTLVYVKEITKAGSGICIVDPVSSGSLISAKVFREFSYPYLKRFIAAISEFSAPPTLHICGNTKKILNDLADSGAGSLSIDNALDLQEVKEQIGDRISISGNIPPTEVMFQGTPDLVDKTVKESLKKAYDSPKGYILALGCALPIQTPKENVHALINAGRKYGRYPYNPELFA